MEETQQNVTLTYEEMARYFRIAECAGEHLTGYIVFTQGSFWEKYSETSRTYVVSSDNKAYRPNMLGYSIFGSALDGSDFGVRLEQFMTVERGGPNGWKIERCYMMADELERAKALAEQSRGT